MIWPADINYIIQPEGVPDILENYIIDDVSVAITISETLLSLVGHPQDSDRRPADGSSSRGKPRFQLRWKFLAEPSALDRLGFV